ncbi:MAG: alanine--tRNA ligase [Patescibacteria group bacterium]|jgi:alanyl-tRNA synthetase
MLSTELRQKYLDFFVAHGHKIISSASLIPENDPTALFTMAGMHPLVPYLSGATHPLGRRLVNAQKCIRTGDIDEVGDATHHTFFEMMGNWSLGDYFKQESIDLSWEFLTSQQWLGVDKNRLAVSVFAGQDNLPADQESNDKWQEIFIAEQLPLTRLVKLGKKSNWWGPAGQTGPCGPDTEIFYWTGEGEAPQDFVDGAPGWVEIWNNVFMEYEKTAEGNYQALSQKNVDTGLGLERVVAILSGLDDNYQTDLFINLIKRIEILSGKQYGKSEETTRAMRIVADHLKAATFIIGDPRGQGPTNTDQGYVVRRLIRRAIRYGRQLEITEPLWTAQLAQVVISDYQSVYPELKDNQAFIINNLNQEEEKFSRTLEKGLRVLNTEIADQVKTGSISGAWLFDIYQSYGFPLELSLEEIRKMREGEDLDEERIRQEFATELEKHQELSRTASAGRFKGGLNDASEETTKLHTATHLLQAALRKVLGEHVLQKGSNITAERLRFDFSHPDKLTPEQIEAVEAEVNRVIAANYPVTFRETSLEEAKEQGALGVFESKYGEIVKVYAVGPVDKTGQVDLAQVYSQELCGGPHVENTGSLGHFKISKEEASSAGVRRIKAILED